MSKTASDDAVRDASVTIAKQFAPCNHLFVWSMVRKKYADVHPAEVYRALVSDPEIVFDGMTSTINLAIKNRNT